MKHFLLLITAMIIVSISFAQITTTKVTDKKEEVIKELYDSSSNFLGMQPRKYIGQEIYLIGKREKLRALGYSGFVKNYKERPSGKNIYKPADIISSSYEELKGKYFLVLDVIDHPKAKENEVIYGSLSYLKLQEKQSRDILYYEYNGKYGHTFPFLTVGYFQKLKAKYKNQELVLRGRNWEDGSNQMNDIDKGNPTDISPGTEWKCTDVTIEEKNFEIALIIENSKGERLTYPISYLNSNGFAFSKNDALRFSEKFGIEIWNSILLGNINVGMTSEMARLSLGTPTSINKTISGDSITEQWVYNKRYLYFTNGVLNAIQNI